MENQRTSTTCVRIQKMWTIATVLLFMSSLTEAWIPCLPISPRSKCLSVEKSRSLVWDREVNLSPTALSMGLRDILGKTIRKGKKGEDSSSEADRTVKKFVPPVRSKTFPPTKKEKSPLPKTSISSPAAAPSGDSKAPEKPPLRMGEVGGQVNVHTLDRHESVQERINRVKAGKMTQEEKQAFLQTCLTAGNTPESRKPFRIPDTAETEQKASASPFPSDTILRNFAMGKNTTSSRDGDRVVESVGLDSQKKKREYLDMVTDPGRFHAYKTYQRGAPDGSLSRISGSVEADSKTPISDFNDLDLKQSESPRPAPAQSPPRPAPPSPPVAPPAPPDLGARLEAAAVANEAARQKADQAKQEIEERLAAKKLEQQRRAEEQYRARQEEMRRQEATLAVKRREEEERLAQELEDRKQSEEARLQELMKAQDDYWTKKLAKEKEKKQQSQAEMEEAEVTEDATAPESKPVEPQPSAKINPGPDEHEILEKAAHDRDEDWEKNLEIIDQVAHVPHRRQTELDFLQEQARQKSEIDKTRDEQLERLRALNSPLPSPTKKKKDKLLKDKPLPRPSFEPQRPVGAPSPRPSPLGTLLNDVNGNRSSGVEEAPNGSKAASPPTEKTPQTPWMPNIFGGESAPEPKREEPKPEKKGPIRMQLPLVDDDEEEDGVDVRANRSMSIADAMKKTKGDVKNQQDRSKKWGIDISKFT